MKYQNITTHLPDENCLYMIKCQLRNIETKFSRTAEKRQTTVYGNNGKILAVEVGKMETI